MQITCTKSWQQRFPEAHIGVLLIGNVDNASPSRVLTEHKRRLEIKLRETYAGFSRENLLALEVLKAYRDYYKQFGNTYHVQAQLESVVIKGKSLPEVSPLVDANFAAELDTLVLTAAHDADLLVPPLHIGASQGGEAFVQLNGNEKTLKPNDMMMSDANGIVCTILYGQDQRTPITPQTRRALYVAYAPAAVPVGLVRKQLESIRDTVQLFAPDAVVEQLELHQAGGNRA